MNSQGQQAEWTGTLEHGRLSGSGEQDWSTGVEYRGEFLDNMRHGQGRMLQRDGTVYEGFWEQGVACGYGCLIQPDGFKHYGLFRNNLLVERLNLQSLIKRDTVLTNQRLELSTEPVSMVRCKSANMQAYEH